MEPAWVSAISATVSTVAAVGSLGVVIFQQWRENKRRDKDDEERQLKKERGQAEQVAAWIEGISAATFPDGEVVPASKGASIYVRNDSNLPVYDLLLVLVPATSAAPRKGEVLAQLNSPGLLSQKAYLQAPPGIYLGGLSIPLGSGSIQYGVEICFKDANGNHWVRRVTGELESFGKTDPRNGRNLDFGAPMDQLLRIFPQ